MFTSSFSDDHLLHQFKNPFITVKKQLDKKGQKRIRNLGNRDGEDDHEDRVANRRGENVSKEQGKGS